jgi:hypothetical protein
VPNQLLAPASIDKALEARIEQTESMFPGREFRLVELAGGDVNIVEVPIAHDQADGFADVDTAKTA